MPGDTKFHKPYHRPTSKKLVKEAEPLPQAPVGSTVVAQFKSPEGDVSGPALNLPANATPEQLELLLNNLLSNVSSRLFELTLNQQEEPLPYTFFVDETEIQRNLFLDIIQGTNQSTENALTIVYRPMAVFRVRTVSRCTASLSGTFFLEF